MEVFIDTKYLPPLVLRHCTYVISINAYLTLRDVITLILQLREQMLSEVAGFGHAVSTIGSDLKQSLFFPQSLRVSISSVNLFPNSWNKKGENGPHVSRESAGTFLTITITAFQSM